MSALFSVPYLEEEPPSVPELRRSPAEKLPVPAETVLSSVEGGERLFPHFTGKAGKPGGGDIGRIADHQVEFFVPDGDVLRIPGMPEEAAGKKAVLFQISPGEAESTGVGVDCHCGQVRTFRQEGQRDAPGAGSPIQKPSFVR